MFKTVLVSTGVALDAYCREVFKMVCEFEIVTVGIAASDKFKKKGGRAQTLKVREIETFPRNFRICIY